MRTLFVAFLLMACASQTQETSAAPAAQREPTATVPGTQPAAQNPPARVDQPGAAQQPSQPPPLSREPDVMTASQAAQIYAQALPAPKAIPDQTGTASASDGEDGSCASDDDCAFTRVAKGQCCPMLCAPRVVTKARAQELSEKSNSCGKTPCPDPVCRPPPHPMRPACVQHKCVAAPSQLQTD